MKMVALDEKSAHALRIRRKALMDAATEVAGHWNDKSFMDNQYQQAQRSAHVLRMMALDIDLGEWEDKT